MVPRFSQQVKDTMDSFIMGLVDVAARPGMISFATGLPDNSLFDTEGLVRAVEEILREDPAKPLQYDTSSGYIPLRKRIADRCRKEMGFSVDWEDILLTNGSQSCFDLMGKMFLDHGDNMVIENPGYLGAMQSFSAYGPNMIGVDVNEEGADVRQLRAALAEDPKFFYAIPNHQNPSGNSYSDEVRRQVVECMKDTDCLLLEDDAYGELGYGGRVGRAMKSMMPDSTVFTGSFSKTISPGMRVGWMIVPTWMRKDADKALEASCLQSNTFCQRVIDRFMEDNDYDAYVGRLRKAYKSKKDFFVDEMEERLPDTMSWNNPDGGMYVWLKSPEGTDADKLFETLVERKLVVMPGHPFHVRGGENTIRLNFATPSEEQIRQGIKVLGDTCRDLYGN